MFCPTTCDVHKTHKNVGPRPENKKRLRWSVLRTTADLQTYSNAGLESKKRPWCSSSNPKELGGGGLQIGSSYWLIPIITPTRPSNNPKQKHVLGSFGNPRPTTAELVCTCAMICSSSCVHASYFVGGSRSLLVLLFASPERPNMTCAATSTLIASSSSQTTSPSRWTSNLSLVQMQLSRERISPIGSSQSLATYPGASPPVQPLGPDAACSLELALRLLVWAFSCELACYAGGGPGILGGGCLRAVRRAPQSRVLPSAHAIRTPSASWSLCSVDIKLCS
jgi:hypothetical protein